MEPRGCRVELSLAHSFRSPRGSPTRLSLSAHGHAADYRLQVKTDDRQRASVPTALETTGFSPGVETGTDMAFNIVHSETGSY